jgi:hypothetical protein
LVFLVVYFLLAFQPITYTQFSSPSFVIHAPSISISWTLAKSTYYEASHYAAFSSLSSLRLLVTANLLSSSPILVTLMMEVTCVSGTSILQEPHCATSQNTALFN